MKNIYRNGLLMGLILFAIILIVVFATGQTFGQRCSKVYESHTTEWCECVERLANCQH
jgi:hypothetical protein